MKIEVGKAYRMRNGSKAVVTGCYGTNPFGAHEPIYPCIGYSADGHSRTWSQCGRFYTESPNDALDLVAEWREPATEERVVYLVRDQAGEIFCSMQPIGGKLPLCWRECAIGSTRVTVTEGVFA